MKQVCAALVFLAFAVALAACGGAPATAVPTSELALPPSANAPASSAFATSTRPATAAALSTPSTPTPGALAAAMKKALGAPAYRVTFQFAVKQGNAPDFLLDLQGEVNGDDLHYSYRLGTEQIELITARGQSYAKGARSIGLPTTAKWYVTPPDVADAARPPFSPVDVLADSAGQLSAAVYQPFARESLDGQDCQVWRAVPKSLDETGLGNALGQSQDAGAFGAIDQGEIKLWVCDDATLHQLSIDIAGHNPRQAIEKGTAKLLLHIWGFDTPIQINPPAGAEPLRVGTPKP